MSFRKTHRYLGALVSLPLLVVAVTGVVLELRNQFEWIQPKTIEAKRIGMPLVTFERIRKILPEGVDQVIYRPGKNNLAVRMLDGSEVQLHPETGEVLKKAQRRTSFLIDIHQGSWMGPWGQYLIHLLSGLGLCYLIISGLFMLPFKSKNRSV